MRFTKKQEPARLYRKEDPWVTFKREHIFEIQFIIFGLMLLLFLYFAFNIVGASESSLVYNHLLNGGV